MLVVTSQKILQKNKNRSFKREPTMPCIFCKGNHFNDSCDKFTTVAERKSQLTSQGRCFVCLKVGHTYKSCPQTQSKSCYFCGKLGNHHRSICPKQFSVPSDNYIHQSSVNVNSTVSSQSSSVPKETNTIDNVNHVNLSHTLLAGSERVLLLNNLQSSYSYHCGIIVNFYLWR